MRYSNSGYVLLGALIEHITGQPLALFLQQNIFDPLGMTRTGNDTTGIRPGHAHGYYADGQQPLLYPMSAFSLTAASTPPSPTCSAGTAPSSTAR
jgi:CubicO group peptidase (beta-lactamase class C family)